MRILFMDDMKERMDVFTDIILSLIKRGEIKKVPDVDWAMNADMAIGLMKERDYDIVFLDHDLEAPHYNGDMGDPTQKDGRYVAKWIALGPALGLTLPRHFHIHSWNWHGGMEMKYILETAGIKPSIAMFPKAIPDVLVAVLK